MDDLTTRRLDELARSDPHLAQPLAFYRSLAGLLAEIPCLGPTPLTKTAAAARLAAGEPLLVGTRAEIDGGQAVSFFEQVCQVIAIFQPGALEVSQALAGGRLNLAELLSSLASGNLSGLEAAADSSQVAPLTLHMLLEYTLRPTLRAWAGELLDETALAAWQRPACPLCGNPPVLAEFHRSSKQRILRCGICGSAWSFPVKRCVHCENSDPASQGLISSDDDPRYRVQTCKRCQTYIKTVICEEPIPHDLLSLEDLASLYLDQGCREKGYQRI